MGICAVFGYLIYATWQGFVVPPPVTPQATPSSKLQIPAIKLNQEHVRRGPEIVVDEGEIGKENPFGQN
jgi:hypothetical protein